VRTSNPFVIGNSGNMPEDTYTHGHHASVLRSHNQRTVENSAAYLIPHLVSGVSVLDVGCGPGTITLEIGERVAPGRVVGIDVSDDFMPETAHNVTFEVGDAYALAFDDDSFDIVHAHQVLQHLSDPVAALREMRRVVKPDGVVAVRDADYAAMSWWPADPRLDRWREIYRAVAYQNDAEPDAARRLVDWATQAGFGEIAPSSSTWTFALPEDRAWWSETWATRTTTSAFAHQALEYGLTTADEQADIAGGWRAWAAHPTSWWAVLHGQLLCRD
jgi:ubiquinone/menaquinone biosynthesis C-methylase UbiE